MRKITICFIVGIIISAPSVSIAKRYGRRLCSKPGYTCYRVKRRNSWASLWPDPAKRRIVMRVNRMNTRLWTGLVIAIPKNLANITHMDLSPLPHVIPPKGRKAIYIDLKKQAFGAYDKNGYLLHWGPIAGGRGYCPDIRKRCNSPRGDFRIIYKGNYDCISKTFPIPDGGAFMPYCMYFFKGYAMHGGILPGKHASHGCIRMFYEDAEWLNRNFIKTGKGATKVIVR